MYMMYTYICIKCIINIDSTLYTCMCVCILHILFQFNFCFPSRMKNPLLAIMIKVEIKTKLSIHFFKEVSPDILSNLSTFSFYFFWGKSHLTSGSVMALIQENSYATWKQFCFLFPLKENWIFVIKTWKYRWEKNQNDQSEYASLARVNDYQNIATWFLFYIWDIFWEFSPF